MVIGNASNLQDADVSMKVENFGLATKFSIEKGYSIFGVELSATFFIITLVLLCYKYVQMHYSCLILAGLVVYFIYTIKNVKKETLLVVQSLGYQIDAHQLVGRQSRFIPWDRVKNIFINEVISKQRVMYVLSLLIKTEKNSLALVPLFNDTSPRLKYLIVMYEHMIQMHMNAMR